MLLIRGAPKETITSAKFNTNTAWSGSTMLAIHKMGISTLVSSNHVDPDQTAQTHRLIWGYMVCICLKVHFPVRGLILVFVLPIDTPSSQNSSPSAVCPRPVFPESLRATTRLNGFIRLQQNTSWWHDNSSFIIFRYWSLSMSFPCSGY